MRYLNGARRKAATPDGPGFAISNQVLSGLEGSVYFWYGFEGMLISEYLMRIVSRFCCQTISIIISGQLKYLFRGSVSAMFMNSEYSRFL